MNQDKFISLRPYLYHLTDQRNIENIVRTKTLFSTKKIVESSNINNKTDFLRTRRPMHETVCMGNFDCIIRDQRPISQLALSKCLTGGWRPSDFIEHLNKRVFFWCTTERLSRHFTRYKHENPCIIRCDTADILQLNRNIEYCRLNSGATRPNSFLGGIAPLRGYETFLSYDLYQLSPTSVVEVTVLEKCILPDSCYISESPSGPWSQLKLERMR